MKTAEPVVEQPVQEKSEGDWKVVPADGLQEVPEELQRLNKDSFSFAGVVSLGVSCINSWVVLMLALGAGLTSGGPTASKSSQVGRGSANRQWFGASSMRRYRLIVPPSAMVRCLLSILPLVGRIIGHIWFLRPSTGMLSVGSPGCLMSSVYGSV